MTRLPVLSDLDALTERLISEERELARGIAELERGLRGFEDVEKPAYDEWIRLSLGPRIAAIEGLVLQIQGLRGLIHRIDALMETRKLHPREALYVARHGEDEPGDAEEQVARREAKREAKRESRRDEKRERQKEKLQKSEPEVLSGGLTSIFRKLARRLHPDSPDFLRSIPESRIQALWMEVQKAYQERRVERLLAIQAWLDADSATRGEGPEPETERLPLSERYKRIRALRRAGVQLEKKLQQLSSHPAWGFTVLKGKAREKLRKAAMRELDAELLQAQEALEALEEFVESIGPPRPPGKAPRKR